MKGKLMSLLLAVVAALALAVPASADIIWEPEDDFYESHRGECVYNGRLYQAAGYDGSVKVYSSPKNAMSIKSLENGERVRVQFEWSGNVVWAYVYNEDVGGWVPMGDLSLVYDSQEFIKDHEGQIVKGEAVEVDFDQAWLYSYPGGPKDHVLKEDEDYMSFDEIFTSLYTDDNGLRWGVVGYYKGHRNGWVCLDDPMNETLDTAVVAVAPSAAQQQGAPTVTHTEWSNDLVLAAALVTAVVILTWVTIRKIKPKKR